MTADSAESVLSDVAAMPRFESGKGACPQDIDEFRAIPRLPFLDTGSNQVRGAGAGVSAIARGNPENTPPRLMPRSQEIRATGPSVYSDRHEPSFRIYIGRPDPNRKLSCPVGPADKQFAKSLLLI